MVVLADPSNVADNFNVFRFKQLGTDTREAIAMGKRGGFAALIGSHGALPALIY